jgi:hypothetical protein
MVYVGWCQENDDGRRQNDRATPESEFLVGNEYRRVFVYCAFMDNACNIEKAYCDLDEDIVSLKGEILFMGFV